MVPIVEHYKTHKSPDLQKKKEKKPIDAHLKFVKKKYLGPPQHFWEKTMLTNKAKAELFRTMFDAKRAQMANVESSFRIVCIIKAGTIFKGEN